MNNVKKNPQNIYTAVNLWFSDNTAALIAYGHISDWNTTPCTHMGWLFNATGNVEGRATFNEDISRWKTYNVLEMKYMFNNSAAFNQNIRGWYTLSGPVNNYTNMFSGATKMIETYSGYNWVWN